MSSTPKDIKTPGNKSGRVYLIDASGGRLLSIRPDGSDLKVIVTGRHRLPDGIVVDKEAGRIYWTEMGVPAVWTARRTRRRSGNLTGAAGGTTKKANLGGIDVRSTWSRIRETEGTTETQQRFLSSRPTPV